jgi:hypothetical protein
MPNRFGDPAEPDPPDDPGATPADSHDPRCRSGWIDRDADHPVPCLRCKPHLDPETRRLQMGLGDKK